MGLEFANVVGLGIERADVPIEGKGSGQGCVVDHGGYLGMDHTNAMERERGAQGRSSLLNHLGSHLHLSPELGHWGEGVEVCGRGIGR